MSPLTPLHHLQQHPRAGSQGVGIATLIFAIFFAIFLRPIEQICPDSAGPFTVSISILERGRKVAGFTATMASSDFPRPCIIGYGSSPSRCGPPTRTTDGQTRDI